MPFAPHLRITALGRLGSASGERFSYGLNMHSPGGTGPLNLQPNMDVWTDLAADVVAFHGAGTTFISPWAVLEEVKFASIGADGRYTEDPVIVNVEDTPGLGQNPERVVPQTALAVSLVTGRRGPTGKGRFYVPMPCIDIDQPSLTITAQRAQQVRDTAQTLINALNNQPGIDVLGLEVCVSSTKGYNTSVSGVRVGRVMDTIRSRRTSLPEAYTAVVPVS